MNGWDVVGFVACLVGLVGIVAAVALLVRIVRRLFSEDS